MTDQLPMPPDPEPLPGMEDPQGPTSELEQAVRRTLRALRDQDLLEPRHAGTMELALVLARAVDAGVRSRRASAAAMAARELRETLAMLPEPEATPSDAWDQLVEELLDASGKGA